jgi:hypothetical protein
LWYWRVAEKLIRLMNIDAVRLLLIEWFIIIKAMKCLITMREWLIYSSGRY